MGTEELHSLMVASLTANACALLFLLVRGALGAVLRRAGSSGKHIVSLEQKKSVSRGCWRRLHEGYLEDANYLAKCVVDSVSALVVVAGGLYLLCQPTMYDFPFSSPVSATNTITTFIFSINVGRYVYKIVQDISTRRTALLSRKSLVLVHVIHHVVTVLYYCLLTHAQENFLLASCGLVAEVELPLRRTWEVLEQLKVNRRHRLALLITRIVVLVVVSLALPLAILVVAFTKQNLLAMHPVSLTVFFVSVVFYPTYYVWLLHTCVVDLRYLVGKIKTKSLQRKPNSPNNNSNSALTKNNLTNVHLSSFQINLFDGDMCGPYSSPFQNHYDMPDRRLAAPELTALGKLESRQGRPQHLLKPCPNTNIYTACKITPKKSNQDKAKCKTPQHLVNTLEPIREETASESGQSAHC